MNPIVEFHLAAEKEMLVAADYYEERTRGAGTRFLKSVLAARNAIQRSPESYPFEIPPYRKYILKKFPYSMIYRSDLVIIYIIALAHHSREPGYWQIRA